MRVHAKAPSVKAPVTTFRLVGLLALALLALLAASAPAEAAPSSHTGYRFLAQFGTGEFSNPFNGVPRQSPRSNVAVDSHGNVFVSEFGFGGSVHVFSPDPTAGGVPLENIETAAMVGLYPNSIAIDTSDDALYVGGPGTTETVRRFVSDGQPIPTYTPDPSFSVPVGEGMAVDPSTHDLLVADAETGAVYRYDTSGSGTLVETIPMPSLQPNWVGAAPDGSFFIAHEGSATVAHFGVDGSPLGEFQAAGPVRAMTVDPTDGDVIVETATPFEQEFREGRIFTYSANGTPYSETGPTPGLADNGLVADSPHGRLYGTNIRTGSAGGTIAAGGAKAYTTLISPGVEAPSVSSVTGHSAHVSTEVDPGAGPPSGSAVHFEYSVNGGVTWKSTSGRAVSGPTTVEADITGLLAASDYLVRAVAENNLLTLHTRPVPFTTPEIAPDAITGAATDIGETSVVINGTVNANGFPTTYHFEFGPTAAYGTRIPADIEAVAGNGRENRQFSRTITGLQPGATYHFRIVAEGELGRTEGADRAVTTTVPGNFPARHYEQVTPPDKHGVPVDAEFGMYEVGDASALAYMTKATEKGSALHSRALAIRGDEDWRSIGLDPPFNPIGIPSLGTIYNQVEAVSEDLTQAFVISNKKLTPGANEDGVNLYLYDIAAETYTLVGTTPEPVNKDFTFLGHNSFIAAAPDMSWIVFSSPRPLLPSVEPLPSFFGGALYRWSEQGGLEVLSTLPDGSPSLAVAYADSEVPQHPVSANGQSAYFQGTFPEQGVFLRDGNQTKAVSVSHVPSDPATPQPAVFMAATEDGRYAVIATVFPGEKLTSDAPGEVGDYYLYDDADESLEYLGVRSAGPPQHAEGLGISNDGKTVYLSTPSGVVVWRSGVLKELTSVHLGGQHAYLSPNGHYLVFSGTRGVERYDADTDELVCVSCMPDGSSSNDERAPDEGYAPLPGDGLERTIGDRYPRVVLDSGQVFYTSGARLVAADVNGKTDAYEYRDGQNHLISPGNAPFNAQMGDVSADGRDVYFSTTQKLVGRDNDGQIDVYDARIGGELPIQNPPERQECLRDDCKATPNAGPELPFGGSEALSGPGNVQGQARKRCGKGAHARKVKGKARCVKRHTAKKRKGNGSAKRAKSNRRQGR